MNYHFVVTEDTKCLVGLPPEMGLISGITYTIQDQWPPRLGTPTPTFIYFQEQEIPACA